MNRPKVLKLFTFLSIFLCILAVQNVAYANNTDYRDTTYKYRFSGSNTQGTPGRTKDTNSMSYIRVDRIDPSSVRFLH